MFTGIIIIRHTDNVKLLVVYSLGSIFYTFIYGYIPVGMVRSRTKATEFSLVLVYIPD